MELMHKYFIQLRIVKVYDYYGYGCHRIKQQCNPAHQNRWKAYYYWCVMLVWNHSCKSYCSAYHEHLVKIQEEQHVSSSDSSALLFQHLLLFLPELLLSCPVLLSYNKRCYRIFLKFCFKNIFSKYTRFKPVPVFSILNRTTCAVMESRGEKAGSCDGQ